MGALKFSFKYSDFCKFCKMSLYDFWHQKGKKKGIFQDGVETLLVYDFRNLRKIITQPPLLGQQRWEYRMPWGVRGKTRGTKLVSCPWGWPAVSTRERSVGGLTPVTTRCKRKGADASLLVVFIQRHLLRRTLSGTESWSLPH